MLRGNDKMWKSHFSLQSCSWAKMVLRTFPLTWQAQKYMETRWEWRKHGYMGEQRWQDSSFFQSYSLLYLSYEIQLPSSVWFASAAYLKPISKCTIDGLLHKEDAPLFVLKASIGKSELQCGLCVWFALVQIFPVQVLDAQSGVEKISAGCQAPVPECTESCSSAGLDSANSYSRAGWNRQTWNGFLRHTGVQLWQTVDRSIF